MTYAEAIAEARRQFGAIVTTSLENTESLLIACGATDEELARELARHEALCWGETWASLARIIDAEYLGRDVKQPTVNNLSAELQ